MWAIRKLNFEMGSAGAWRKLELSELEELHNDAYKSSRIFKAKTKVFHDKHIMRKNFTAGQQVLLYNSRLHLFPRNLRSRWTGPYIVRVIFPHGAVEVEDPKDGTVFKVNG
jgi:hypothetical protein